MIRAKAHRRVPRAVALLALLASVCAPASGGEVELAVLAGRSLPFYEQSFDFDPRELVPPNLPVSTSGGFDLELGGGLTFSGAVTWRFSSVLGLEARVDSARVELGVVGGSVGADLGELLPGLPPIPVSGDVSGETRIDRLTPISLNLHLAAGSEARFVVSGGASYIPATTLAATVSVVLGGNLPGLPPITLPPIGISAAATLDGGLGGNLGVGFRIPLGAHVALAVDARGFVFPEREVQWGPGSRDPSPLEEALARALDPIEFEYGFFQATGGLAFTF
jgi:hypothetical protein